MTSPITPGPFPSAIPPGMETGTVLGFVEAVHVEGPHLMTCWEPGNAAELRICVWRDFGGSLKVDIDTPWTRDGRDEDGADLGRRPPMTVSVDDEQVFEVEAEEGPDDGGPWQPAPWVAPGYPLPPAT